MITHTFAGASIVSAISQSMVLKNITVLFAAYWGYAVVAVVLGYLLLHNKEKQERVRRARLVGLGLLSALIARFGVVVVIRALYVRSRPFVLEGFQPLIEHAATPAFPSGHATFFAALAVLFVLAREKRMGWFLALSALFISIARVLAGVHWPADVVAGWAVGIIVSAIVWWVYTFYADADKKAPSVLEEQ